MKDISASDLTQNLRLVIRTDNKAKSTIQIGNFTIGGEKPFIVAGPCRVESLEQMTAVAQSLQANGVYFLRGGIYKPCTFPYASTGMGIEGLSILKEVKKEYSLLIVSEIMDQRQIERVIDDIDVVQIGARNMQNYDLLKEIGTTHKPIILKRHPGASLRDFLGAAEWIMAQGNEKVVLCERGVTAPYTHDKDARWALDITVIPAIRRYSHLPVIIDPSHSAGVRDYVPALSRAGIAAGADGLIIETHPNPDQSHSDPMQTIDLDTFGRVVSHVREIYSMIRR